VLFYPTGTRFITQLGNNLLNELERILYGKADDATAILHKAELIKRSRAAQHTMNDVRF